MLTILRSSLPVLVMLSSISVLSATIFTLNKPTGINNHFLDGYPYLTLACAGLLEPREFGLGLLKFKVIDVDIPIKLVFIACYGTQYVCVYLQPFSR